MEYDSSENWACTESLPNLLMQPVSNLILGDEFDPRHKLRSTWENLRWTQKNPPVTLQPTAQELLGLWKVGGGQRVLPATLHSYTWTTKTSCLVSPTHYSAHTIHSHYVKIGNASAPLLWEGRVWFSILHEHSELGHPQVRVMQWLT